MSKNFSELSGRKSLKNNLFDRIGKAAEMEGTPSVEELKNLADEFLTGKASVYGTTTFYDFLKPENKNKKVYVCNGTACVCAGTQEKVNQKLNEYFIEEEIGHMTCLGRCHENHAFHINGRNYSGDAINKLTDIIFRDRICKDDYNVRATGKTILTAPFTDIKSYYAPFIEALRDDPAVLLKEIKMANLRGRGGAGFPIGLKLEFCRKMENDIKFIICNADEGDPGAYSDRYLLEERPHSILFGMLIAGYVAQAHYGVIYLRAEYPEAAVIIEKAIEELSAEGLIGNNIYNSGFNFDFKLIRAQGSYICGEETALINSIEGQRPEVRVRPPYPAQQGLFNKPTVVNNVETLAALHYIVEHGGDAWKSIGTDSSSGTKLVCLDSMFKNPGVFEIEMGTPLSEVIYQVGGGFKTPVKAIQVGGPLGGLVPLSKVEDLALDFESFAKNGFLLGHASIIAIPEDFPIIKLIEHLFDFAAYESCGKCFPCRLGTKRGHEMVLKTQVSDFKIKKELFDDLLLTLEKGSLCAHGGGIPLPIRNAMEHFKEELEPFFT